MKCYSNPKHTEQLRDELFVQRLIHEKKSQERRDFVTAVLGIFFGGAVIVLCWVASAFFGG